MNTIYRIVGICLGIPSETFVWEYLDKSHTVGPITPLDFYEKYIKPVFDVDEKVCLVTDPRETNPYGRAFTTDLLGNVVGGRPIIYNNQSVDLLMSLAGESVKNNEAVWFGCEVAKRFATKPGMESLKIYDSSLVFGVEPSLGLTKAEILVYDESAMTQAMVFTAVSNDSNGVPVKFRVEDSWGEGRGEKSFLLITSEWFKEFVFEVVVDKKYIKPEVMEVFKEAPVVLPPWVPMGTLAKN